MWRPILEVLLLLLLQSSISWREYIMESSLGGDILFFESISQQNWSKLN